MTTKLNTDKKTVIRKLQGNRLIYICPKCENVLHIATKYKKNLCMGCGQYLNWEPLEEEWYTATIQVDNHDEANFFKEQYKRHFGENKMFDSIIFGDRSQLINRKWPKDLMFIFLDKKNYGRFMRFLGKEGVKSNG